MIRNILRIFLTVLVMAGATNVSFANWRSDIGIFRIGVFTGAQSSGFLTRSEPFRLAIQEALGMEVEFFPARSTEALIDALRTDRIEYALLSSSAYALAWHLCECVEPLVSPRSNDSTDGYHSIIIAREGGPQNVVDIARKQVAELSPGSISQSHLVKRLLAEEGIDVEKISFGSQDSGEETLAAFLEGEYDVLLGWSSMTGLTNQGYSRGTLARIAVMKPGELSAYRVIWQSPNLPHRPHVVRKKLPAEAKNILRDVLLGMFDRDPVAYDSIEPVYGGGFATSRHGRFRLLLETIKDLEPAALKAKSAAEETALESENPPE